MEKVFDLEENVNDIEQRLARVESQRTLDKNGVSGQKVERN